MVVLQLLSLSLSILYHNLVHKIRSKLATSFVYDMRSTIKN